MLNETCVTGIQMASVAGGGGVSSPDSHAAVAHQDLAIHSLSTFSITPFEQQATKVAHGLNMPRLDLKSPPVQLKRLLRVAPRRVAPLRLPDRSESD